MSNKYKYQYKYANPIVTIYSICLLFTISCSSFNNKNGMDSSCSSRKLVYEAIQNSFASCVNDNKYTKLHVAVISSHVDMIRALLQFDGEIDVNARDKYGCTALHHAVINGQEEIVRILVENSRVNVNVQDEYGCTALHHAVIHGQEEIIRILVENSRTDITIKNIENQYTPLHYASIGDNESSVRMLLPYYDKAGVNAQDINGYTALDYAVYTGNLPIVKQFLASNKTEIADDLHCIIGRDADIINELLEEKRRIKANERVLKQKTENDICSFKRRRLGN